jgi:hypothetical protein
MLFEQNINQIYNEIGKNAGLKYTVELKPYARFKMGFNAKHNGDVYILSSDYIKFAKAETIMNLAERTTKHMKDKKVEICDSMFLEDFSSPNVYKNIRPLWASRCHGIIPNPKGAIYDLNELYKELLDNSDIMKKGEFKSIDNVLFTWKKYKIGGRQIKFAETHPTPRAITVNKQLDNPKTPREVMLYLLYHELLHIDQGIFNAGHDPEFRRKEARYPNACELEKFYKGYKC